MPSKKVPLVIGEKYHVYNRGVDKRTIFKDKFDYLRFYQCLDLFNSAKAVKNFTLAKSLKQDERTPLVEIKAYSLLSNHFHLIVVPLVEEGLGEFMRRVSSGYTSYFNEKYERSGSLFQGKFKRVHIETSEQYLYLEAYINENHYVHGLNSGRELYHSSSLHHQQKGKSKLLRSVSKGCYPLQENINLALDIYGRRKDMKDLLE